MYVRELQMSGVLRSPTPHENGESRPQRPEDKLEVVSRISTHSKGPCPHYPVVGISGSVDDFRPEETFAEGVSNGLALPVYALTVDDPDTRGEQIIHTLFRERRPRWSSAAWKFWILEQVLHVPTTIVWQLYIFLSWFTSEATVHTLC